MILAGNKKFCDPMNVITCMIDVCVLFTQGLMRLKTSSSNERFLSSNIISATINKPHRQNINNATINKTESDNFFKKENLAFATIYFYRLKNATLCKS